MRMKVWGEISGEHQLVGTLETIPGREEQFAYADSYLANEVAQRWCGKRYGRRSGRTAFEAT